MCAFSGFNSDQSLLWPYFFSLVFCISGVVKLYPERLHIMLFKSSILHTWLERKVIMLFLHDMMPDQFVRIKISSLYLLKRFV